VLEIVYIQLDWLLNWTGRRKSDASSDVYWSHVTSLPIRQTVVTGLPAWAHTYSWTQLGQFNDLILVNYSPQCSWPNSITNSLRMAELWSGLGGGCVGDGERWTERSTKHQIVVYQYWNIIDDLVSPYIWMYNPRM